MVLVYCLIIVLVCLLLCFVYEAGYHKGYQVGYNAGIDSALITGQHFVDNYVKKLTPEDTERIYNSRTPRIPEENLRALDLDENAYKKMMGWESEEEDTD